jgi:hypothetical protein
MNTALEVPGRRLALLTAAALAVATLLFAAVVLPAEYGRDPTGFGRLTGLTKLSAPVAATPAAVPVATDSSPARSHPLPFRSDVIEIPLGFGDELEYKVRMQAGDVLVYSWVAEGVDNAADFYFDFHGEVPGTQPEQVVEYLQATGSQSAGSLVAPMAGVHGWYLQNQTAGAVVVKLKLSGFYELVPPGDVGNLAGITPRQ